MFEQTWSSNCQLVKISRSSNWVSSKENSELTLLACLSTTNLLSCGWNSPVLPGTSEAGGASGIFSDSTRWWLPEIWTWLVAVSHRLTGLGGLSVSQSGKALWGAPVLPVSHLLLPLSRVPAGPHVRPGKVVARYQLFILTTPASLNVKCQQSTHTMHAQVSGKIDLINQREQIFYEGSQNLILFIRPETDFWGWNFHQSDSDDIHHSITHFPLNELIFKISTEI